ncbi:nucleoside diphosphate kinase [Breznakibacter xylanolyticus]|uniref:Nucleoside diphosphate kinase n=1 Tax=Breznakibacter xylanolyticus TaxID=990 RepID=A0A2W7N9U8_9BACT|nr:nucleoside-diphosphate kinase [Breznakibacter xylanolyticus]MBN2742845.1 nucleoside-diphosphate kinase [Marinilabiliaceae bacterium]PZX16423.1 nucleoside diphosphate kinase [Breznakibacter xylanolyticus]
MIQQTLAIIKPDSVRNNYAGKILSLIVDHGFSIKAIKGVHMDTRDAQRFYGIHTGKPFFDKLVDFITSGPCIAMILEKENAVDDFRKLMGATDPNEAEGGTIRSLFAENKTANAIHGSDSSDNAFIECNFFFSIQERF